jgi:preprotein translocase subunit SecE
MPLGRNQNRRRRPPEKNQSRTPVHGPKIYKPTQGKYTRVSTVLVIMILGAWGCYSLASFLQLYSGMTYVNFGIPVALLVGLGMLMFWMINRPKTADFLIATEGEMKKVSWSSKKEVVGSTKVVIVTTFLLAALLFLVDFLFGSLFLWMGVR